MPPSTRSKCHHAMSDHPKALSWYCSLFKCECVRGLGRKFGAALQFFVTFLGGLVYAFYASWRISLIILTTVPVLVASTLFLLKTNQTQSARASEGYAEAGSIVQTTVASIRTILSLNAVKTVIDKFSAATQNAFIQSVQLLHLIGAANGALMASMVLGYVVVALYGAYLLYDSVRETGCDPSGAQNNIPCDPSGTDVFGSLMGITFAATVLPQVQVGVEAFTNARAACYPAIQVINRKVGNDENDDSSTQATGPARRSSVTPKLDFHDIRDLNVHWLRKQIGLVSQVGLGGRRGSSLLVGRQN